MGMIAATANMPSSKFVFSSNPGTVKVNTAFTIKIALNSLGLWHFVDEILNYYAAPQQVNRALTLPPVLTAPFSVPVQVDAGLPAGTNRLASIDTAPNHQPVIVAVAQHCSLDVHPLLTSPCDPD